MEENITIRLQSVCRQAKTDGKSSGFRYRLGWAEIFCINLFLQGPYPKYKEPSGQENMYEIYLKTKKPPHTPQTITSHTLYTPLQLVTTYPLNAESSGQWHSVLSLISGLIHKELVRMSRTFSLLFPVRSYCPHHKYIWQLILGMDSFTEQTIIGYSVMFAELLVWPALQITLS